MTKLPALKLKMPDGRTEICDFEKAKNLFYNWDGMMLVIEEQLINSYDELVKLAKEDSYKGEEVIEAMVIPVLMGG